MTPTASDDFLCGAILTRDELAIVLTYLRSHKKKTKELTDIIRQLEIRTTPECTPAEYEKYIAQCDKQMTEGEVECDVAMRPAISISDDGGAYVQTWTWVDGADAGVFYTKDEDDLASLSRCNRCNERLTDDPPHRHVYEDGRYDPERDADHAGVPIEE